MNTEDKILQMLEQVVDEQKAMRTEMSDMCSQIGQQSMRTEMSDMCTKLTRVAVTQENVVLPRLNLLMEDHNDIKNQIKSLSAIDELKKRRFRFKARCPHVNR